jgi:L-ascorbate metabolism protein UlaG (beta-lactamase superfamily)
MIFGLQVFFIVFLPVTLIMLLFHPQFGGRLKKHHKEAYSRSKQWNGKEFDNLVETTMDVGLKTMPGLLKAQFTNTKVRTPEKPIPIIPFDKKAWNSEPDKPKFIWYGHSVLLLQLNGKNLLIDPMLGSDASPIAPIKTKRFSDNSLDVIDSLPKIDAVLYTHDHYDHIDLKSVRKLMPKVDKWFVGLGIGRHLERWKIPSNQITEFDWWQEFDFEGIKITYTPSRHFTGRGPFDRQQTLWGGWVFKSPAHNIFWSGDGGYGEHFKEIGKRLGPFDHAFMENGQYNKLWRQIHLHPEESVQAAIDAQVKVATPVHWSGFALALHPWKEPIERFTAEAKKKGLLLSTPRIGEIQELGKEAGSDWWSELR